MNAAWRLTRAATAGHEASKAGAHVAGFLGIWEVLAAQVGLAQVFTACQGERERVGWRERALGIGERGGRGGGKEGEMKSRGNARWL